MCPKGVDGMANGVDSDQTLLQYNQTLPGQDGLSVSAFLLQVLLLHVPATSLWKSIKVPR